MNKSLTIFSTIAITIALFGTIGILTWTQDAEGSDKCVGKCKMDPKVIDICVGKCKMDPIVIKAIAPPIGDLGNMTSLQINMTINIPTEALNNLTNDLK